MSASAENGFASGEWSWLGHDALVDMAFAIRVQQGYDSDVVFIPRPLTLTDDSARYADDIDEQAVQQAASVYGRLVNIYGEQNVAILRAPRLVAEQHGMPYDSTTYVIMYKDTYPHLSPKHGNQTA